MRCSYFSGSNCNHDMMYALGNILGQEVVELWHKDTDTQNCELIVLPGGFSYGDYLRSGAIARFSLLDAVNNLPTKEVYYSVFAMVFKFFVNRGYCLVPYYIIIIKSSFVKCMLNPLL